MGLGQAAQRNDARPPFSIKTPPNLSWRGGGSELVSQQGECLPGHMSSATFEPQSYPPPGEAAHANQNQP